MTNDELLRLALDALENLMVVQNGPPLIKYEAEWNAAMQQAQTVIDAAKHNEGGRHHGDATDRENEAGL